MTSDYEAIAATGDALLASKQCALVGMVVTRLEKLALLVENIAVAPPNKALDSAAQPPELSVSASRREMRSSGGVVDLQWARLGAEDDLGQIEGPGAEVHGLSHDQNRRTGPDL